jgi:hypothetical protein
MRMLIEWVDGSKNITHVTDTDVHKRGNLNYCALRDHSFKARCANGISVWLESQSGKILTNFDSHNSRIIPTRTQLHHQTI